LIGGDPACYDRGMRRAARGSLLLLAALLPLACSAPAPVPAPVVRAEPPRLIPLSGFFANREANWGYRVSPDGSRLGWIASHRGRSTIFFKPIGTDAVGIVDSHSPRAVQSFAWAQDSRRVLYRQDRDGDENQHVYLADTERPEAPPRDLTPWPGALSWIERVIRSDPEHVVIGSNRRDHAVFDLYRVSLSTGEARLLAENPGDVVAWLTDWDGQPRARLRHVGPDGRELEVRWAGVWRTLQTFDLEESDVRLLGVTPDDRGLWLLSSRGRDRRSLVRVDFATGAESLVYEHPRVDLDWVRLSERTRSPLAVFAAPDYPEARILDTGLAAEAARLAASSPTGLSLTSVDDDERRATVQLTTDRGYESFLLERGSGRPVLLGRSASMAFADALATVEPVAFTARDGLRLHGYLTRPPGFSAPGPMVLLVHGGHWWRDYWGYDSVVQFLANRGYAVLQVNYRGSSGYGRRFSELAVGEYAGKMHDDLIDGVRWAVERGIADPARVAISGGSYGGYATLVGLTFTPDVFACGVSVVGMSNLVTLYENMPPYWKLSFAPRFRKYVGDPSRPEDRQRLEAKSPLFRADHVKRPVLIIHGANDVRVKLSESEQMVTALKAAGKDVRFVVLGDEGHLRSYGNWRNSIRHYGEMERFLAACLGGRSSTTS
jgi:dipeptidyl aminopeptidase/acylaminoacyl peptidase